VDESRQESSWRERGVRTTSDALECLAEAAGRSDIDYCWAHRDTGYFRRLEARALAYFTKATATDGPYGYWRATAAGIEKWEAMKDASA
jgi:hypothetical protein